MSTNHGKSKLSTKQLLQINSICNDFEAAWKEGLPLISDYVAVLSDSDILSPLLHHLVELDIECRVRQDYSVEESVYHAYREHLSSDWLKKCIDRAVVDNVSEIDEARGPIAVDVSDAEVNLTPGELMARISGSQLLSESQLRHLLTTGIDPAVAGTEEIEQALLDRKLVTPFQLQVLRTQNPSPLVLGDYVLLDQIGQGGMGTVYRAQHRRMNRIVAVKVLRKDSPSAPEIAKRFRREVKVAARLTHPNIVTAFDAREEQGLSYLVSEFIAGQDLSQFVRSRGPLSLEQAVEITRQIAAGLRFAHRNGVIHRDVKPSNVLLGDDGVVRLLDVGLARFSNSTVDSVTDLTTTGLIIGTVDYMAPEQARDTRLADERSDIYSVGCTLSFLLTGRALYPGGTNIERLLAHRELPIPDIRQLDDRMPDDLQELLTKCLAKDPEQRFQNCDLLLESLNQIRTSGLPAITLGGRKLQIGGDASSNSKLPATDRLTESQGDPRIGPSALGDRVDENRPWLAKKRWSSGVLTTALVIGLVGFALIYHTFFRERPPTKPQPRDLTLLTVADVKEIRDNWAAHLSQPPALNLIGVDFVLIPPGESFFGGTQFAFGRPFYLSTTEITVGQFRQFVNDTGYRPESLTVGGFGYSADAPGWIRATEFGWDNLGDIPVTDRMPATSITWHDAVQYCVWASRQTRRTVRLPEESEWEYASRCGRTGEWCFGDNASEIDQYGWTSGNAQGRLHEAGRLSSNAWGLFDMHGNEWEWCQSTGQPQADLAVRRGGGFESDASGCRHMARKIQPKNETANGAFRVLMELP